MGNRADFAFGRRDVHIKKWIICFNKNLILKGYDFHNPFFLSNQLFTAIHLFSDWITSSFLLFCLNKNIFI